MSHRIDRATELTNLIIGGGFAVAVLILLFFASGIADGAPLAEAPAKPSRQMSVNTKRLIPIRGVIDGPSVLQYSRKLQELTNEGNGAVYLYINSPGGSVTAGYYLINQMTKAQGQGVKFICLVDDWAASMAFQIYAHCDSRYAFSYSGLLWHAVRVGFMGYLTPKQSGQIYHDLSYIEEMMTEKLINELNISLANFWYHYDAETLHYGVQLHEMAPKFLTIVDSVLNFESVKNFQLAPADKPNEEDVKKVNNTLLPNRKYQIEYIYRGVDATRMSPRLNLDGSK